MSSFQTIASGDLKDVVVSNDGKIAYVSNSEGVVSAFDLATGDFVSRWKIGTTLGGMDLSQDGRYLVATERSFTTTGTGYDTKVVATVHVLDLVTGQVRDYTTTAARNGDGPFYDAVFTSEGKILLSQSYQGSGWEPITVLDPATGAFVVGTQSYSQDGVFSASKSGAKIIFAPQNISDMPIFIYEAGKGITVGHEGYADGVQGYNAGFQAISPAGDLIIQGGNIYDGNLTFKGTLATFQKEAIFAGGMAFSPDGASLYVFDTITAKILQLSTTDWSIQKAFDSGLVSNGSYYSFFNGGAYGDRVTVSGDGKYLVLLGDKAMNVIDLTTVTTQDGSDKADTLTGDAAFNTIRGYGGNDVIDGGAGNDSLYGGAGDDRLIGGAGDDVLDGGAGFDMADYSAASVAVTVELNGSTQNTGVGRDTLTAIEGVIGGAFADTLTGDVNANRLEGGGGNDVLKGKGGADTLLGGAGDDLLNGGGGDDVLDGGDGVDVASYEDATAGVRIDLNKSGVMQNTHGDGLDSLKSIEGIKGSAFNDVFVGSSAGETFQGGRGDDIIDGGGGVDTAIYGAASTNYAWTHNADGTWTVRDLRTTNGEGVDTLLNVEQLQFTDKTVVLSSSDTAVTANDLVRSNPVDTIATGQITDAVLSPDGKTAYVGSSEGYVTALNTATGDIVARWKVGTQLGGMDVSTDGRYIVVADRAVENVTYTAFGSTATIKIHVLDTLTGAVKDYAQTGSFTNGFFDVAFTSDNKVLFGQDSYSSNAAAQTLDLATGVFSRTGQSFSAYGMISATADHTKLLFSGGLSDAALYIYAAAGQTAYHGMYADGVYGYGNPVTAITDNGNFVAQFSGSLYVYDGSLRFIQNVSKTQPDLGSGVFGMDFSADGRHLYVVDATTDRIFQFSTANWAIEQVYGLGVDVGLSPTGYYDAGYGDRVIVSADGTRMLISSDVSVVSVDLTKLKAEGGTDNADILVGTSGADRLQGYGGDDTLSGGDGDDVLIGGEGSDLLKGGAGADKLDGGGGSDWADYREAPSGVTVNLNLTSGQDTKGAGVDTLVSIENLWGSAFGDTLTGDSGANYIDGQAGNDVISGGAGADTLMGGDGDDILIGGEGDDVIFGNNGFDTASYETASSGVVVDLSKVAGTLQNTRGAGVDMLDGVEALKGSSYADTLTGDASANVLDGGAGDDVLNGGGGDDVLTGGAGNDTIDGGTGNDTVRYSGAKADYSVVTNADGTMTVTDLRAGAPDGVDRLINIDTISFSAVLSANEIANRTLNILRLSASAAADMNKDLLNKWTTGALTADQVTQVLVNTADATTSVASMNYQIFTGKVPTKLGVDFLISPTGGNANNLNSAYYARFDPINRYINFAVNLGKNGEAKDSFAADYGSLSLFDATKKAYGVIFGGTPTDAKVHQLLDSRIDFLAWNGGDGPEGIGTKAAMVGFLLAAAATENLGVIAKSNDAWLTDLADGAAPFAINILDPANGYYKADYIFGG